MPSFVQLLVAVVVTGLLVGFDRTSLLVTGAVAGVWPDFLAWVLAPLLPWPDLVITPDPDRPEAATIASGLRLSRQSARAQGRPWRVRLSPVPARTDGRTAGYELDLDRLQVATVRLGDQAAALDWRGWLPRHPLPLRVASAAVDLVLTPLAGGRVASDVAPAGHPAGHTWLGLPMLVAAAAAWPEAALVAGVVTALHLALDYGSHAILTPLWPVSTRATVGLRTWDGTRRTTALRLGWLAALALAVAVLTEPQARQAGGHPLRLLVFGAALSGLAVFGVRRLRPALKRKSGFFGLAS